MRISMQARTARRMGRLAAVGAVALVLAGSAAAPAAAMKRSEALARVNRQYDTCFRQGGESSATEQDNVFTATCVIPLEDGTTYEYSWEYTYGE